MIIAMQVLFQTSDSEFVIWYHLFAEKSTQLGTLFPNIVTPAVITQINANRDHVNSAVDNMNAVKNYISAVSEYKRTLLEGSIVETTSPVPTPPTAMPISAGSQAGIKAWTRRLLRQIKAHPSYTTSIGESLGIIAPKREPSDPTVKVRAVRSGSVELRIGRIMGRVAVVESRRGGDWEVIGYADRMIFIDSRPSLIPNQAEFREYRTQGYANNRRLGGYSLVVGVWTLP